MRKRCVIGLVGGGLFLVLSVSRAVGAECEAVRIPENVAVGAGEMTLADRLPPGVCRSWYEAGKKVSLGAAPALGSVRTFDRGEVRHFVDLLGDGQSSPFHPQSATARRIGKREDASVRIPERVVVRRAGPAMTCEEIRAFVAQSAQSGAGREQPQELHCAAAYGVPRNAALELTKTSWNPALARREFALRCLHPAQCVPFLVWARGGVTEPKAAPLSPGQGSTSGGDANRFLVKRGQTATLTWEEAGLRMVLPVTCLEAGSIGQSVLVRFQNAARTLRAEVVGAGMLRAAF